MREPARVWQVGAGCALASLIVLGLDVGTPLGAAAVPLYAIPVLAALLLPTPGAAAAIASCLAFTVLGALVSGTAAADLELRAAALVSLAGVTAIGRWIESRATSMHREQRYAQRAFLDNAPMAIDFLDRQGRLVRCNQISLAIKGATRLEEVVGKHITELIRPEFAARGYLDRLRAAWDRVLAGESIVMENEGDLDGTWITYCATLYPLRDASGEVNRVVRLTQDLTELRASERHLREREMQFSSIIDHAPLLVAELDENRDYVYANRIFRESLGHSLETLTRQNYELVHPDDRDRVRVGFEPGNAGRSPLAFRIRRASGSWAWFEGYFQPYELPDGRKRTAILLQDVTERRALEEQFLRAQKMEAVGQLASGVAHDFNNALTVISNHAELIELDLDPDHPLQHQTSEILSAVDHSAGLVRQLLTFARTDSFLPEVLDLDEIIGELAELLSSSLGEAIQLEVTRGPGRRLVRTDPIQLGQVVLNLAFNARDAMPAGGKLRIGARTASGPPVGADVSPAGERWAVLECEDAGSGIETEVLPRIFEPFFTTKEPGRGTGLGLSTAYSIVQRSNGTILVDSELGHGTRFEIWLPLDDERDVEALPPNMSTEHLQGTETLLLVEDDELVRTVTRELLELHGYPVLAARSAAEALQMVRAAPERVDLLVADMVMPGANGPDIARQLRELRPGLPVLFISGYAPEELQDLGDGDPIVQKPYSRRGLLSRVREILDASAEPAGDGAPQEGTSTAISSSSR